MTATSLLANLRARGLALSPQGDGIAIAPRKLLTDADRAAVLSRKAEILSLLAAEKAQALLASAVRREFDAIDAWTGDLRARGVITDLSRYLREEMPDLHRRIASAEAGMDAAVLAGDLRALDAALASWSLRWRAARRAFESAAGLRMSEETRDGS